MNWITETLRPRIKSLLSRRETEENLWVKCPQSGQMVFVKELEANHMVVPSSGYHMRMGAAKRLAFTFDNGMYEDIALPEAPLDPLKFRDEKRYSDRLRDARAKTGMADAIKVGVGQLGGVMATIAVQDMDFMGGSLGTAAGEAIIKGMMVAAERKTPFIIFTASGGARMQEGILSLMQMPRSTVAIQMLHDAGLPYIVVLTDPTSGGVMAAYAMLGDIQIAEPKATLAFTGRRVIEQTIREKLPDDFQTSEYYLDHGMIDMVVARKDLPATLAKLIDYLCVKQAA